MPTRDQSRIDLVQGTLDLLILQTLQWGPQHGHGIGQAIRISSQDALQVEHGSLYPALHRLESRGWLSSEWRTSEANRRAKYYKLTPQGKKQLLEEQSKWKQLVRAVARTMNPSRSKPCSAASFEGDRPTRSLMRNCKPTWTSK